MLYPNSLLQRKPMSEKQVVVICQVVRWTTLLGRISIDQHQNTCWSCWLPACVVFWCWPMLVFSQQGNSWPNPARIPPIKLLIFVKIKQTRFYLWELKMLACRFIYFFCLTFCFLQSLCWTKLNVCWLQSHIFDRPTWDDGVFPLTLRQKASKHISPDYSFNTLE